MRENGQRTSGVPPAGQPTVFGAGPGPGIIEPVIDPRYAHLPPQDIAQPFIVLDDSGVFSRVLLARTWSTAGKAALAAVRLQKDVPAVPATRGWGRSYTNRDALAEFEREADCRRAMPPDNAGIIPIAGPATAAPLPIVSLPLTYCKKTRQFFHPVCPTCGDYLRDCRDELLLGRLGLPGYETTSRRVLYCPTCSARQAPTPTVYVAAPLTLPRSATARIRIGSELYRDFGRLLAAGATEPSGAAAGGAGLLQFACLSCPHRAACYPSRGEESQPIPAEKLLFPVAYHEFCALPRAARELHFDEFVQLLGGRPAEDVQAAVLQRMPRELLGERTAAYAESHSGTPAYVSPRPGPLFATEVLWLKLGAFEQLCEGLRLTDESCDRPHLDLQPKSVMAAIDDPVPGRPLRWSFHVGILNPATAVPVKPDDHSPATSSAEFLSQPYFNRLYTSPMIRRQPYGHEEYANFTIRSIEVSGDTPEITGDVVSEVLGVLGLAERDRLRITLSAPGGPLDGFTFWAEILATIPGGYRVLGRPTRVPQTINQAMDRVVGQTLWDCRVNVCRRYGLACDLYSLGMMLFGCLLVNDEQDEAKVCLAVESVGHGLESFARLHPAAVPATFDEELQRLRADHGDLFSPSAVLFHAADRQVGQPDLPLSLWLGCQKLGFQMVTGIPGFSILADHGSASPGNTQTALKQVNERLKDLNLWAEGRLFGRRALRRELDSVRRVKSW